jgi:hypothetical protein
LCKIHCAQITTYREQNREIESIFFVHLILSTSKLKLKIFTLNVAPSFSIFALCKLLFVHNAFYTYVKFCLQETIPYFFKIRSQKLLLNFMKIHVEKIWPNLIFILQLNFMLNFLLLSATSRHKKLQNIRTTHRQDQLGSQQSFLSHHVIIR